MVGRDTKNMYLITFIVLMLLIPMFLLGFAFGQLQDGQTIFDIIFNQSNVFQNLDFILILFFIAIAVFALAYIIIRRGRIGL